MRLSRQSRCWPLGLLAAIVLTIAPQAQADEQANWLPGADRETRDVQALAFSPDGSKLAVASSRVVKNEEGEFCQIQVWDVPSLTLANSLIGRSPNVFSVAFSPDGERLASAENRDVQLWDMKTGEWMRSLRVVARWHIDIDSQVVFSSDSRTLLCGYWQGIKMWDGKTGDYRRVLPFMSEALALSPDNRLIATVQGVNVRMIEFATGRSIRSIMGDEYWTAVAFAPDNRHLVRGNRHGIIEVWDIVRYVRTRVLQANKEAITDLKFSPDGQMLATGGRDKVVRLWDFGSGEISRVFTGHTRTTDHFGTISSLAFSPDGRILASGSYDGNVNLWHIK